MRLNDYEPVVKALAAEGVPVTTESSGGYPATTSATSPPPGPSLRRLPHINIFAYVLLPGTEFFERRDEYDIRTQHLSPCDGGRGDYVVSTFVLRADGVEGYVLCAAQHACSPAVA